MTTHFKTHNTYTAKWMCNKCGRGFKTHHNLAKHYFMQHEHGQFECGYEQCDFVGETRNDVRLHQDREHRGRNYQCQFDGCRQSFQSDTTLASHERLHLATKRLFKCRVSLQIFSANLIVYTFNPTIFLLPILCFFKCVHPAL